MRLMRTIDEAAAFLRQADPNTAVTKTALRRLIRSGEIPSVRVGAKYLVDLGVLDEFFGGQTAKQQTIQSGTIIPALILPQAQQKRHRFFRYCKPVQKTA